MSSSLTIFTSPKPFTDPHIAVIQRNAIRSWKELGEEVEILLFGDEEGAAQAAEEIGVRHIPQVRRNSSGTPLLSDMFAQARTLTSSSLFGFVNADILLLPDFLETARELSQKEKAFLAVGQRWDMNIKAPIDFSTGWQKRLKEECAQDGKLHKPTGSDYFIFPRSSFETIPDFAIGRAGWDNWMLYEARQRGWKLIDATSAVQIIHQNHDYAHLPEGKPHYHLPETDENIHLAGGKRHIFLLQDVNWKYANGQLVRPALTWKRFWREAEIFPLVALHSEILGNLSYSFFHPQKAYNEFRKNIKEARK